MTDLADALHQALQVQTALDGAKAANAGLIRALEAALVTPVEDGLNRPSSGALHRAEHRMGVPSRIDQDPELRAGVLARITRMTYKQVVADAAEHFPPDRRTNVSSLQRWWRKQHPA